MEYCAEKCSESIITETKAIPASDSTLIFIYPEREAGTDAEWDRACSGLHHGEQGGERKTKKNSYKQQKKNTVS